MLKRSGLIAGTALLVLSMASTGALADDCSGRDHAGGTVLGAIAGGVLGGVASHGNGLAIAGGAIFGGLAGNALSRDIDCDDRDSASRAYYEAFDGDVGERYEWEGRHGGHGYIVVNDRYERHGRPCVDFTQVTWHHDERFERNGTACRRHGEWEIEES
jgi:surface antigen